MKTLILGRNAECDIRIEDRNKLVSREHARLIIQSNGDCVIEDLGSMNKTYLNGRSLSPNKAYALKKGDLVELAGKIEFDWQEYQKKYTTIGNRSSKGKSKLKEGTVLRQTLVGEYFDKLIPVPGFTKNVRLLFNLHFNPIDKIMGLIDQTGRKAEAHPFSFFAFSLVVYFGLLFLVGSRLQMENVSQELGIVGNKTLFPILFAIVNFIYSWLNFQMFKRLVDKHKPFMKFLKLTSLSQGMLLIHAGLLALCSTFMITSYPGLDLSEPGALFLAALWIIEVYFILFFLIVNVRAIRRFWDISWGRFIPYFFIVALITAFVTKYLIEFMVYIEPQVLDFLNPSSSM